MVPDEILEAVRENARDTVDFLGNARKVERERSVCAAFLRCAGIEFSSDQLVRSAVEPPDVTFGDARFEVMVCLRPGRPMHGEWKERQKRYEAATTFSDLFEPYTAPRTIPQEELVGLLMPAAARKAEHYAKTGAGYAQLDLLVYINDAVILDPASPPPNPSNLAQQGWRSVSALVPPHAWTVFARDSAPQFLMDLRTGPVARSKPPLGAGLFEL
jgi:hypothetical protein